MLNPSPVAGAPQGAFDFADPQPRAPRPPLRRPQAVLNAAASLAAKQEGQDRAEERAESWAADVLLELEVWCRRQKEAGVREVAIEDFRAVSRCKPVSHKAWGVLPRLAVKAGLLRAVRHVDGMQKMRPAKSVATHAHPVRVWEVC